MKISCFRGDFFGKISIFVGRNGPYRAIFRKYYHFYVIFFVVCWLMLGGWKFVGSEV